MGNDDFTTLEAAMARDWLNMQIKIHDMRKESCSFNGLAAVMPPDEGIHMPYGIGYMADLLGLELKEKERQDCMHRWEYSFVYGGTRFYQIERERLEGHAGEAVQE